MRWPQLHETLAALVESVSPGPGSGLAPGRADARRAAGDLGDRCRAGRAARSTPVSPHSRWVAGFLPRPMSQLGRPARPSPVASEEAG